MWDGITTVLLSILAANIMVNLFCGSHLFVKQKISSEMKNFAAFLFPKIIKHRLLLLEK